jgi:hypothetical protein
MRQVEANVGMPVRRPNHRVQSPRPTTKASGMAQKPTTTTGGASGTKYDPSASEGASRQEECADGRPRVWSADSWAAQEGEQPVVGAEAVGPTRRGRQFLQGPLLHRQVRLDVGLRRAC